jgi:hypothetical protein
VRHRKLPPPAASRVYELTEWGEELEPVIIQLRRWGARSPSKPRDAALGVDSLILSFRTMFYPHAANGLSATYELRLDEDVFRAVVTWPLRSFAGALSGPTRPSRPTPTPWPRWSTTAASLPKPCARVT